MNIQPPYLIFSPRALLTKILCLSIFLLLASLIFSFPASLFANSFTGQCIDVADGDTITVQTQSQEKIKVRLSGVDCPETFQVHGEKAKQYLSSLVSGKRVRIEPETLDQFGRTVGMVLVNGANINEMIVANGHGWVFRKYCTAVYCNDWLKLEASARAAKIGLWEDANPKSPWEWRAEQREKNSNGNVSAPATALSTGTAVGAGNVKTASIVYHGNTRSSVFHGPGCKDYNCKNCTVPLGSMQEAANKGFRPHRACVRE